LRSTELAFPQLPLAERKQLVRGCFDSLGRQLGEFSQFMKLSPASVQNLVDHGYDAHDKELYDKARQEGRGIIFLASHLGAWEVLVFAQALFDQPISFLVRRIDNPLVEELIENRRTRFGNRPIDKREAASSALRVLRQGGMVGILGDLNSQQREGVFVPFFGHQACTTKGIAALAIRTNAVVIPVCAPWDRSRQRYVIRGGPLLEPTRTGDFKRDIVDNTARFTAAIESQVRAYPDQWLWIHKRWKTRPLGEPDLYPKRT
jgi:Kdo2-lipid IVA lauroyltransferase/acyltransferase